MIHGRFRNTITCSILALATLGVTNPSSAQTCDRIWEADLFTIPGPRIAVHAMASWDDGTGTSLYAGYQKWDGLSWTDFGGGFDDTVSVMLPAEIDGQSVLIVGGNFQRADGMFVHRIAAWDGQEWHRFDAGLDGEVFALAMFDDGSGPSLYAGGAFDSSGGTDANGIARWNGTTWETLGDGVDNGSVQALHVFDDGTGEALYVGGTFDGVSGIDSPGIARWDGQEWTAVSDGAVAGVNGGVYTLEVWDDDRGPALYAGGRFDQAGGQAASNAARWDGARWERLGPGVNDMVRAFYAVDDGPLQSLYAGGDFDMSGGARPSMVARWNGRDWITMSGGTDKSVYSFVMHDAGDGPKLHVGGNFDRAGQLSATFVASWDAREWGALGEGLGRLARVLALAAFDDGSGQALYAGGDIPSTGHVVTNHIVRWTRDGWAALGSGVDAPINVLLTSNANDTLYAGGEFEHAGGAPADHIAAWTGSAWSSLGEGVDGTVHALVEYDDGRGLALYAGGAFDSAGAAPAASIARWDGVAWEPLGAGLNGPAYALAVYQGDLYAAGSFTFAGDTDALNIARWDGADWSPADWGINGPVHALAVFDEGTGPSLFAGGFFGTAGRGGANNIARWDGTLWSPLGSGLSGGEPPVVRALLAVDDARGRNLIVSGGFTSPRRRSPYIVSWDGVLWQDQDFGVDAPVEALVSFDDGQGRAIFAGGRFFNAGFKRSRGMGRLACPPTPCRADFDGDGELTLFDFLAFQIAFDLRRPSADFDGDALITLFDFLAFQNEFYMGCP